ncbi:MAG: DUF1697 domain-containing protein, partial [Chloroflexi bacterium]|nr:DUF1697 domain-containing protein [Chloroflexota bacterium]
TSLGFANVRTLLASGNVVFEASNAKAATSSVIEAALEKAFGKKIGVIVRTGEALQAMVKADPFKGIKVTPETRLYVTFLGPASSSKLKLPYESPDRAFRILCLADGALYSVLTLTPGKGTVDAMDVLEKEYGKQVTTRNWNTVQKITALI